MPFQTGLITSPAPSIGFSLGNVATPDWANTITGNCNALYSITSLVAPVTSSDSPQFTFKDALGNVRYVIDHNGYPMGHGMWQFWEDWRSSFSTSSSANPVTNLVRWRYTTSGGGSSSFSSQTPTATYPTPFAGISFAPVGADNTSAETALSLFTSTPTFTSVVVEFDVGVSNVTSNDSYFGLFLSAGGATRITAATTYAYLRAAASNSHWFAENANGGSATSTDVGAISLTGTGDPVSARVKIEVHGSGSPYGACVRFFLNESLVTTSTTNLPSNTLTLGFGCKSTGATANAVFMGDIRVTGNKRLSLSAL